MRKRRRLLVAAPVLAGLLVISVVALTSRQRPAWATSKTQLPESGAKTVVAAGPVKLPPQDMPGVLTRGSLSASRIEMTPQGLHIAARARVMDIRPESRFFWGCRVYSTGAAKALVFEKLYLDQTFQLPDSHKLEPTLDDTLVFPADAGKYRVEMILFTIPPGFDLTNFRDPKAKETYKFASCSGPVVIP
jgi:hypothetical protein